jgi:transcriptional regulator with XRE-family HTH domain
MVHINTVLREARKQTGKTQKQIADEAGVCRSYYADIERGRYNPSLKILSRLGNILHIDLNFLKQNDGNTND